MLILDTILSVISNDEQLKIYKIVKTVENG